MLFPHSCVVHTSRFLLGNWSCARNRVRSVNCCPSSTGDPYIHTLRHAVLYSSHINIHDEAGVNVSTGTQAPGLTSDSSSTSSRVKQGIVTSMNIQKPRPHVFISGSPAAASPPGLVSAAARNCAVYIACAVMLLSLFTSALLTIMLTTNELAAIAKKRFSSCLSFPLVTSRFVPVVPVLSYY